MAWVIWCSCSPTLITVGALGALVGSLHLKSLDVLLAGPTPAPFSAMTRNSYSLPSVRLVTRCRSSVMGLLEETLTHWRLFFSLLSKMYCLISLPPSDLGLVQHMVMLFPVTWVASGVPGASGTAVEERKIIVSNHWGVLHNSLLLLGYLLYCIWAMTGSESRGFPTPNLFTAEILNWYSLPLMRLVAL